FTQLSKLWDLRCELLEPTVGADQSQVDDILIKRRQCNPS
ncbi:MAG: hypothetical protein RL701_7757, partial [Pseudomonadota bacterium]